MVENTNNKEAEKPDNLRVGKKIAHYQETYSAWHAYRLEFDKQILTISVLAVGFLITQLSEPPSTIGLILWLIAETFFLLTISLILFLLSESSDHLSETMNSSNEETEDNDVGQKSKVEKNLDSYSKYMRYCFYIAIIFSCLFAIYKYILKY